MGLPWIKVAVDLPDHPKLDVFEHEANLWSGCGFAVVGRLWCWTARLYPDGRIPRVSWRSMARNALRDAPNPEGEPTKLDAEQLVECLRTAKLAVVYKDFLVLHDWDEFNSAHARKLEQNRDAVRRYREKRQLDDVVASSDGNPFGNTERHPEKMTGHDDDSAPDESRGEERRVEKKDQERASPPTIPHVGQQHHREPWDPAILKAVQESLRLTDLDDGWGQFVGQSLQEPVDKRHAAAREFLRRRCAQDGKDWPYLLTMIRNGAGRKTQPATTFEAHAPDPDEVAAVDRELAEIRRRRA